MPRMSDTPKFRQLINPHQHSDYSLDGASTVKQIVKRSKDLGATHVTCTEHGNMNSAMELYKEAKGAGLTPILGIEAYLINPFHAEYVQLYTNAYKAGLVKLRSKKDDAVARELDGKAMGQYMHVTVHFKDEWAYKYFCGLSKAMWSRAITKNGEKKPLITLDELKGAAGHITIGSSCMKGPVQISLLPSRDGIVPRSLEKSELMYNTLREIAGKDSFFVEIFPHTITHDWQRPQYDKETKRQIAPGQFVPNQCTCDHPDGDLQKPLNRFVYDLAKKNGDKAIISLDAHFALPQQKVIQDAKLSNGDEQWRFHESYYIMESTEAAERLKKSMGLSDKDVEEMIDNSYHFASQFNNFKIPTSKDRWILEDTSAEFMGRLNKTIEKYGRMDWNSPEMVERLKKEVKVLAYNGKINLLSYLEKVEDIANFCRENDVLINVRGSAGGCLLLYLIGVSAVNPLKHNLSFERFLTEGRIKANTLPDADIDVSDQEKVFGYLKKKYGDRVCRLSTDTMLRLKSSIQDAERTIYGRVRPETENICKSLPTPPQGVNDYEFVFGHIDKAGVRHIGLIEQNPKLQAFAKDSPDVWAYVSEMMGIQRQKSIHPCGVIIADRPVQEYAPIMLVGDEWATGFSPKSAEAAGLVKFDILGLNTLRDIQDCLRSIKQRSGKTLEWMNLPFDANVFEELRKGKVETVFQLDSATARPLAMTTNPNAIDDICANTSLGRPGTLDAPSGDGRTLAEVYVARKNGEPVTYIHPELEHIMKETSGIQLYQEQTLQIFRDIGNLSYEEAEDVRRGIGKKDEKVLLDTTFRLKKTCLAKGWTEQQVNLLIEQIMASARYSFNKSHAMSYAYVAYACLYLKTNYKLDWWKATLSNADKNEMVAHFWRYVQDFVLEPDINRSTQTYEIEGDKIVAPLSILNGVGPKAYDQLIKHVPYKSFEDFVSTHLRKREKDEPRSAIHRGIAEKLVAAGILDSLLPPGLDVVGKVAHLNEVYGKVRDDWPEPVNERYVGITGLGKYMVRKQLISIYSKDLRSLMLESRGGRIDGSRCFMPYENAVVDVLDGNQLEYLKNNHEAGIDKGINPGGRRMWSVIAYVIEEKDLPYKQKSKHATKMVLDVNGYFYEEVLWPPKGMDTSPKGFKGLPVWILYSESQKYFSIERIIPLLKKEELEKYNVV